jgi:hypothetical protein
LNNALNADGSPRPEKSGLAMTVSGFRGGKQTTIDISKMPGCSIRDFSYRIFTEAPITIDIKISRPFIFNKHKGFRA